MARSPSRKGSDALRQRGASTEERGAVTDTVNGKTMQDSNTKNLICNIQDMVAYLSEIFMLEPGDCISTGTPAGVGMLRGIFLQHGDVCGD